MAGGATLQGAGFDATNPQQSTMQQMGPSMGPDIGAFPDMGPDFGPGMNQQRPLTAKERVQEVSPLGVLLPL